MKCDTIFFPRKATFSIGKFISLALDNGHSTGYTWRNKRKRRNRRIGRIMIDKRRTFTTQELAKFCDVTPRTITQWIREGKIRAYHTPGKHSRVEREDFVRFLKDYNMPIPDEIRRNYPDDHGRKRVLIVDDDPAMVSSMNRVLADPKRYIVESAYNGFEAGQKFTENKPDLVILDILMPRVSGYQLCRSIRNNPKNDRVKILVVSGVAEMEHEKVRKQLRPPRREISWRHCRSTLWFRIRTSHESNLTKQS
jgi:excisionase family DNA binding protein